MQDAAASLASPLARLALRTPAKSAGRSNPISSPPKVPTQGDASADELRHAATPRKLPRKGASSPETPLKRTPARSTRVPAKVVTPQKRDGAQRPSSPAADCARYSCSDEQQRLAPGERPVVVLVEGTEGVDPGLLEDFIVVMSEVGFRFSSYAADPWFSLGPNRDAFAGHLF